MSAAGQINMDSIGFIGLGVMGKPMAHNLIKAGFPLVVNTRTRAKADDLLRAGAAWADTPKQIASQCHVVITMLPDTSDVELVIAGKDGLLQGTRTGMLVIDMSTISPMVSRKLAKSARARGVEMLDAPVSGGEIGAINATLSIMVGGTESAFNRAQPILQRLGKNIVHIGDSGAGQIAKAANQIVVGLTIEAVSEALVLSKKAGVDPIKVRQALLGGFAQSRVLDAHGQRMLERNFKAGARVRTHHKDLNIALSLGKEFDVPLPVTEIVESMFSDMLVDGKADLDHSSLVTFLEDKARIKLEG
jgi:2-hydroxy-3-oxopropionate reductase